MAIRGSFFLGAVDVDRPAEVESYIPSFPSRFTLNLGGINPQSAMDGGGGGRANEGEVAAVYHRRRCSPKSPQNRCFNTVPRQDSNSRARRLTGKIHHGDADFYYSTVPRE